MSDDVDDLRAEIARLKKDAEVRDARIWALSDFLGGLNDALCVKAEPVYIEFMSNLRGLYRGVAQDAAESAEWDIQKKYRSDTFDGL